MGEIEDLENHSRNLECIREEDTYQMKMNMLSIP